MQKQIEDIKNYGKAAKGRSELFKHLSGKRLTRGEAVLAKCYECEAYYQDGKEPCPVRSCPLWPFNAYTKDKDNL